MGKLEKGVNDLESYCRQNGKEHLLKEWHPMKNGDLKPTDVAACSHKKVWWLLHYYDAKMGKHFDFEWEAIVKDRVYGNGCPYLCGQAIWKGYNDFETYCYQNGKENLLREWHSIKNENLKPSEVTVGYKRKVWWYLPYDDIKTGEHFDFEWQANIIDRVMRNEGCPYLSGNAVWQGYNDFETYCKRNEKENLLREWHFIKNGNLKPTDITAYSSRKVWWYLPYDDSKSGKHFNFEWEATIASRVLGCGCPYLSGNAVWKGYNDLETYCIRNEKEYLLKEWNYKKNNGLKPDEITISSNRKVWWLLPYDDIETGEHFDFEWKVDINSRVYGDNGCPYLSGNAVWKGYNDLETYCIRNEKEYLLKEWNYKKNKGLMPDEITIGSNRKVWWILSYDDKITGKHFNFEWQVQVKRRVQGENCPYLSNQRILKGYNDLETYCKQNGKEYLLDEWNIIRNMGLKPSDVARGSNKKVWWLCKNQHIWEASISSRIQGRGCPCCKGSKTEKLLYKYLKNKGISFVAEKKFQSISVKFFSYDVYLYKDRLIIEADGMQHFEKVNFFVNGLPFEKRVSNDNIKNTFCLNQKIPILRIPYTYHPIDDKEKIEKIVDDFIQTKQVPDEILDFYRPYKDSIGSNYFDVATTLNKINQEKGVLTNN